MKENVILDRVCPDCNRIIIDNRDFCECGFFLKAHKNSVTWSSLLSSWLAIGLITLIILINLNKIKLFAMDELQKRKIDFTSVTPVNVQIITGLKNSPYDGYVQNIYVKPREDHKLVILIKPTLWNTLSSNDRKELLFKIDNNWKVIYTKKYPYSSKKPAVDFANIN